MKKLFLVEIVEINEVVLDQSIKYKREVEVAEDDCESLIAFRLFEEAQDEFDLLDSDEVLVFELKQLEI